MSKIRTRVSPEFIINNVLLAALIVLLVFFATQSSEFLNFANFKLIITNNAAIGVLCAILTLLVIAGHVDLSVGSNIGFCGVLTSLAATQWGLSGPEACLVGIAGGATVGAINGVLCGFLRFNPIIVTLGMLGAVRGATELIHQNEIFGLGSFFTSLANGTFDGISLLIIIVALAFLAAAFVAALTPWGRHIYAMGINRHGAYLAGLPVRALPFALYVATGAAAGLAGVMLAARLNGADAGSLGLQMELQALTIILLGGVAFTGGRGRILGVVVAWIFLGTLQDGLVLMNVSPFVQEVASGLALVFAAGLDALGASLSAGLDRYRRMAARGDGPEASSAPRRPKQTTVAG